MRIIFNKLKIHNFMSFKDEEFDFHAHSGIVAINGLIWENGKPNPRKKNGAGKSTLFNSVRYCLYGIKSIDNKVPKDSLVNSYSDDNHMYITVDLNGVDGKHYVVTRGIKSGSTYLNVDKVNDDGSIESVNHSVIAETDNFLQRGFWLVI